MGLAGRMAVPMRVVTLCWVQPGMTGIDWLAGTSGRNTRLFEVFMLCAVARMGMGYGGMWRAGGGCGGLGWAAGG